MKFYGGKKTGKTLKEDGVSNLEYEERRVKYLNIGADIQGGFLLSLLMKILF